MYRLYIAIKLELKNYTLFLSVMQSLIYMCTCFKDKSSFSDRQTFYFFKSTKLYDTVLKINNKTYEVDQCTERNICKRC